MYAAVGRRARSVCALVALAMASAGCADESATPADSEPADTPANGSTGVGAVADTSRQTFTTADGTRIEYVLVVPDGRDAGAPGKVLLAFPPGGQDIELAARIVESRWHDEALARDWVVVSPAAPSTGLWFSDASAAVVPELLDHIAEQFPPDDDRFDLAGVSNGGLSAFRAAMEQPERFRSLVVFPGYSVDGGDDPNLDVLRDIGVAMFVGAEDSGWLGPSQQTEARLKAMDATVELHVVAGEGHIIESLTGTDLFDAMERVRGG